MRRSYLLSGLAFCAGCGSALWVNSTKQSRHTYYKCSSRSRDVGCPDRGGSVRGEIIEEQVAAVFSAVRLPSQWRDRVEALAVEPESNHAAGRAKIEARINRARQGFVAGILDEDAAKSAIRDAERELAALPQPDATKGAVAAGTALSDIHELWPHMTGEERRSVVQMSVYAVVVDLSSGEVLGMLPKDHFAPLFRIISDDDGGIRVADWPDDERVRTWRPRADSGSAGNNRPRRLYVLRRR